MQLDALLPRAGRVAALCALMLSLGCDAPEPEARDESPPANTPPQARATAWREFEHSYQAAIPAEAGDAALAAAIAEARATLDAARARWETGGPLQRSEWAIKWAAPRADGAVEHVWVRPATWSRFRIEGVLASPPRGPLQCGKHLGEFVSFPVEEVSDWVHFTHGNVSGPRKGGFTIDALEERLGQPTTAPRGG
jgi:uncharacterized protein YegJ (DUF2314 family)